MDAPDSTLPAVESEPGKGRIIVYCTSGSGVAHTEPGVDGDRLELFTVAGIWVGMLAQPDPFTARAMPPTIAKSAKWAHAEWLKIAAGQGVETALFWDHVADALHWIFVHDARTRLYQLTGSEAKRRAVAGLFHECLEARAALRKAVA